MKIVLRNLLVRGGLVALSLAACKSQQASEPSAVQEQARAQAPATTFRVDAQKPLALGLDEASMDPTANPCDDFYQYACGGWMQRTEIPPDRARYSRGFMAIADRNELLLKDILEQAAAGKGDTPYTKQ